MLKIQVEKETDVDSNEYGLHTIVPSKIQKEEQKIIKKYNFKVSLVDWKLLKNLLKVANILLTLQKNKNKVIWNFANVL